MPGKRTKVYAIPGRFIPGVPATDQTFESQADADRFLEEETGGIRHSSAFALTRAEATQAVAGEPDDSTAA
jgi:hypothetical protein